MSRTIILSASRLTTTPLSFCFLPTATFDVWVAVAAAPACEACALSCAIAGTARPSATIATNIRFNIVLLLFILKSSQIPGVVFNDGFTGFGPIDDSIFYNSDASGDGLAQQLCLIQSHLCLTDR